MSKNLHTNDFRLKYLKYKKYGGAEAQVDDLWFDSGLA
jgi:hypothetical protein